ncbi:hypothetical protein Ancab_005717 [Ancistrocladus abbreviatus]
MDFKVEQAAMEWLKGSYVARVHYVEVVPHLQQRVETKRLSRWFTDIRSWSHKKLVSLWGTSVRVDECTRRKESFEMARELVLATTTGMINEVVRVKVNDHIFPVMVVKEREGTSVWPVSGAQCKDETPEGVSGDKTVRD